jgi:hypothetical protein
MSEDNKEKEKAKYVCRVAKGALTGVLNTGRMMLQAKRSQAEIQVTAQDAKNAYDSLASKHDEYTMFLDDTGYEEAENWMDQCTHEYTEFMITFKDYENHEMKGTPVTPHQEVYEVNEVSSDTGSEQDSNEHAPLQESDEPKDGESSSAKSFSSKSRVLKHERPKPPQFLGDVRKYFIFKADFQHAIESQCSERDAITILSSCLGPEPSKLVEGISTELKVMWQYLDQNYGDPRIILDTVTADIEKFKPIQEGEDHKFCELVNLVRRNIRNII